MLTLLAKVLSNHHGAGIVATAPALAEVASSPLTDLRDAAIKALLIPLCYAAGAALVEGCKALARRARKLWPDAPTAPSLPPPKDGPGDV